MGQDHGNGSWPGHITYSASPWPSHEQQAHFTGLQNAPLKHPHAYHPSYTIVASDGQPALTGVFGQSPPGINPQPYGQAAMHQSGHHLHVPEHALHSFQPQQQRQQQQHPHQGQHQHQHQHQQHAWTLPQHAFHPARTTSSQAHHSPPMAYTYGLAPPHWAPYALPAMQPLLPSATSSMSYGQASVFAMNTSMRQNTLPLPRGPPRKPRRSGHAVWVGNIPIGASIEALKDHFSRDAQDDIESVFLMSKSNCAFVNYRSDGACDTAVERHNHSLFGAVRLLCRLRRDTSERSSPRQTPESSKSRTTSEVGAVDGKERPVIVGQLGALTLSQDDAIEVESVAEPDSSDTAPLPCQIEEPKSRYFILKSLTKEDLQESLQRGTWETQIHNQEPLDQAFRTAEKVYLIFSVNKSGEYFGYARMTSSPYDVAPPIYCPPLSARAPKVYEDPGLKVTMTAATEHAPAGCIVSDASRGTLFWEAISTMAVDETGDGAAASPAGSDASVAQSAGKSRPFGVEWLSVRRVTFQRTKGLRNPWNANKEIKVARDGTELETEVGARMVSLFHEN